MTTENTLVALALVLAFAVMTTGWVAAATTVRRLRGRPEKLPQAIKDECYQEVDGFYNYGPKGFGYLTADDLRSIASYLDGLNAPYAAQLEAYFKQDKQDNPELYRTGQGRGDGWD